MWKPKQWVLRGVPNEGALADEHRRRERDRDLVARLNGEVEFGGPVEDEGDIPDDVEGERSRNAAELRRAEGIAYAGANRGE